MGNTCFNVRFAALGSHRACAPRPPRAKAVELTPEAARTLAQHRTWQQGWSCALWPGLGPRTGPKPRGADCGAGHFGMEEWPGAKHGWKRAEWTVHSTQRMTSARGYRGGWNPFLVCVWEADEAELQLVLLFHFPKIENFKDQRFTQNEKFEVIRQWLECKTKTFFLNVLNC